MAQFPVTLKKNIAIYLNKANETKKKHKYIYKDEIKKNCAIFTVPMVFEKVPWLTRTLQPKSKHFLMEDKQIQTGFPFRFNDDDTRNGHSVCTTSITLIAAFFKCQPTERERERKKTDTNCMFSMSSCTAIYTCIVSEKKQKIRYWKIIWPRNNWNCVENK